MIDSLQNIIYKTEDDTLKMQTYNQLRRATYYSDPKMSEGFTEKYLEYAKKIKDSQQTAIAHFYIGNANVVQSNFEKALTNYFKASDYFEQIKDSSRYSSTLNGIGAAYENSGNDSLSLKYFKRSQSISKSIGDKRRSAIALNSIANIYKRRGELELAKKYMENAVSEISETSHQQYINLISMGLANIYNDLEQYEKASTIYADVVTKLDTVSDVFSYATALKWLGHSSIIKNKKSEGLRLMKQAYSKFEANGFSDEVFDMMPDLINAYKINGNYKEGLELSFVHQKLKDSIFTVEKDRNLSDALQKYETEKKDAQLKLISAENEKAQQQKRTYIILAIAGLLFASLLGYFGYKNRQKNKILDRQKKLLEATLDEKNVLLKEVHHRVKNSFQIVSSLLYLQSESVEDKEAKIAIKEAENRVRSMVLIHQKLYNKDELVGINTRDYFHDLVSDIFESHQFTDKKIEYQLDIEPMVLDVETITPIGLILNELIINTLKHAFVEVSEQSKLIVNFNKEQEGLQLIVADNGKGFVSEIKESSFGIRLMKALSKKLKATLDYTINKYSGTTATLIIKKYNLVS
ncbi:tetratricopeptide repeat-containing sensor histidine kinase [Winogradskyella maritima]|uniref:histidine kinase n=1 Tax=Winogradskyella maritima TaxID=1517766 RepID=A0ABV8AG18_9FLAO